MGKQLIYRHGQDPDPPGPYPYNGYYDLSWSPIYGCWSNGEPGFGEYSDAGGSGELEELEGTRNVDYRIFFEILDITADFKIRMDDGTWLTQVGDRYNLSNLDEHHAHMNYRAYVPETPPPDYPFHVTYQLVDDIGMYEPSEPFSVVFNAPAPAVEKTMPLYQASLPGLEDALLTFTFHRAIAVDGGPPVDITDVDTHTQDYYTGYFDYAVSPDGMTLTLNQIGGMLLNETWLEVALTEHVRDAVEDRPAIPYTQFVFTRPAGDLDCSGVFDVADVAAFVLALIDPDGYAAYDCDITMADVNRDGLRDGRDIQSFVERF